VLAMMDAGVVALLASILATPVIIEWFRRRRIGQHIREDLPTTHAVKAGTPTMGGLAIVGAVILGYFLAHFGPSVKFARTGQLVIITIFMYGVIGFVDDWLGIRHQRSLGLRKRGKFLGQVVAGVVFSELAVHWAHVSTALSFTRSADPGWHLGEAGWVVFATFVLVATANAVNFTDGVDGLAAGTSTFCFAVLAVMGYWIFRHVSVYGILPAAALDLAICSVALAGGCLGFLWWNAAPARIIMGDTGSLAIGSGLAALSLQLNLDLLLPILGGLFVIEILSVVGQVISFRLFGHRRILRMAPIHHHCELLGWPETTVMVRFWMLGGLFAALALGIFYGEFLVMTHGVT
jgi:phospho-N-acetylmuramoyl-pentapeptide-transferase